MASYPGPFAFVLSKSQSWMRSDASRTVWGIVALMGGQGLQSRVWHSWRVLLALLCVLLVILAGAVQVAHTHADRTDAHANCSLCAAAHITVHLVQAPAPVAAASVVATLDALPPSVLTGALLTFALFTRPPPAATLPA